MILQNIRVLCTKRNISLTKLEQDIGLSNGVIGKWKESSPSVANLKKVADYFGVTVDELLREEEA